MKNLLKKEKNKTYQKKEGFLTKIKVIKMNAKKVIMKNQKDVFLLKKSKLRKIRRIKKFNLKKRRTG